MWCTLGASSVNSSRERDLKGGSNNAFEESGLINNDEEEEAGAPGGGGKRLPWGSLKGRSNRFAMQQ
jgi:hypothetical protein